MRYEPLKLPFVSLLTFANVTMLLLLQKIHVTFVAKTEDSK